MLNGIKSRSAKKSLILFLMVNTIVVAQSFKAADVIGQVKFQSGSEESWSKVEEGFLLNTEAVVVTGRNSTLQLVGNDFNFRLKENSAVSIGSIKKLSLDELLLALAMEDLINAPKKNGNGSSDNTAVYGNEESSEDFPDLNSGPFGIKRLNGAIQLASTGLKESAVIFAKETFRKYPDTKSIPYYRIYFANVLYDKGLYEEALEEFNEIINLDLNEDQQKDVKTALEDIKKILLSN
jgi:tetratricopeptide (TPR) repeat protein